MVHTLRVCVVGVVVGVLVAPTWVGRLVGEREGWMVGEVGAAVGAVGLLVAPIWVGRLVGRGLGT